MKIFSGVQEWLDKPDSEGWWWFRPARDPDLSIMWVTPEELQDIEYEEVYVGGKWQKAILPDDPQMVEVQESPAERECIIEEIEKGAVCRNEMSHYCPNCDNTIIGLTSHEWQSLKSKIREGI